MISPQFEDMNIHSCFFLMKTTVGKCCEVANVKTHPMEDIPGILIPIGIWLLPSKETDLEKTLDCGKY